MEYYCLPHWWEALPIERMVRPGCLQPIVVFPCLTERPFKVLGVDELAAGWRVLNGTHGPRYRLRATLRLDVHKMSADECNEVT